MQRYRAATCILGLCIVVSSCRRSSDTKTDSAADVGQAKGDTKSGDATSGTPIKPVEGNTPGASGWTIKAEEVQKITGVAYDTTNQPADFPNIKHWEFSLSAHSVSLLIATGNTAAERMKNSKLNKHRVISGFRGEAIWEPIQGRLTVLDGGRCAEVVLSKSHGDEAKRLEFAKALATLLLDKR